MTAEEARAVLMEYLRDFNPDYPLPWVGNMIRETQEVFAFEATMHKEGEDPRDDYGHWVVNKTTGDCLPDPADLA